MLSCQKKKFIFPLFLRGSPAEYQNQNKVWNMFKVNNKPLASFWAFIINFEHISHSVVVSLLLALRR